MITRRPLLISMLAAPFINYGLRPVKPVPGTVLPHFSELHALIGPLHNILPGDVVNLTITRNLGQGRSLIFPMLHHVAQQSGVIDEVKVLYDLSGRPVRFEPVHD